MTDICPYKLYTKIPNDIHYGKIYTREVELPILYSQNRTIRVYLPEDFDENKKYPVLFMSDGQNIVDKYTSAFGVWSIDIHQHELIQEGYRSFIVVGIDSGPYPLHRALELSLPFLKMVPEEEGKGLFDIDYEFESHLFLKYVACELLPEIRRYFPISDRKEDIAVGGSSMGGLFAYALTAMYPDIFGFSLIFSPGFFLYKENDLNKYLDETVIKLNKNKLYFYCGGKGFESKFTDRTISAYNHIKEKGYSEQYMKLCLDKEAEHNEKAWSNHFNDAIRFWFNKKK